MKLYQLAIKIQGQVDKSLSNSVSETSRHMSGLEKQVKELQESYKNTGALEQSYAIASSKAEEYGRTIGTLTLRQKDISGYQERKKALVAEGKELIQAKINLRQLKNAYGGSKLPEHTKAIKEAKAEVSKLEKSYKKNKDSLGKMEEKLKEAGIDTKNLADEQSKLAAGIDEATKAQEKQQNAMKNISKVKLRLQDVGTQAKKLGRDLIWGFKAVASMGAAIGAAAFGVTNSMAAQADAASKAASQLNMSTESLQEFQYAAKLSGVDDFNGAVSTMNLNVARAVAGQGKAVKGIKELGISAKQLQKMGPEKAMTVLADRLNGVQDPAKKARIAFALWGEQSTKMLGMMSGGAKGLQALRDEAIRTGAIIPAEVAKQAVVFNDTKDKMMTSFIGLRNILGAELLPVFTELFGEVALFFQNSQPMIKEFAKNIGAKMREVIPEIKILVKSASKVAVVIWNISKAVVGFIGGAENLGGVLAALPFAKAGLSAVILAVKLGMLATSAVALGAAFWLTAGAVLLVVAIVAGAAYLIYKNWDWLCKKFNELSVYTAAWVKVKWNGLMAWFGAVPDRIMAALSSVVGFVSSPFIAGYKLVKGGIDQMKQWFDGIPDDIKTALAFVCDIFTAPFKTAFNIISNIISKGWDVVKNVFGTATPAAAASVVPRPITTRARGGLISTPTISTLAERGPEWVIPAGEADRGRGISVMADMMRKTGLVRNIPKPATTGLAQNIPKPATQTSPFGEGISKISDRITPAYRPSGNTAQQSVPTGNINFAPSFNITGDNPQQIADTVMNMLKRDFSRLLDDAQHQKARVAYGAV